MVVLYSAFGTTGLNVSIFPFTAPQYARSLWLWSQADAKVAEVEVVLELNNIRYAPRLTIACMPQYTVLVDKIVPRISLHSGRAASAGNTLVAKAGNDLVAIHIPDEICHRMLRSPDTKLSSVHATVVTISGLDDVFAGKAGTVEQSMFKYQGLQFDQGKRKLISVSAVSQSEMPARKLIPLSAISPVFDREKTMGGILPEYFDYRPAKSNIWRCTGYSGYDERRDKEYCRAELIRIFNSEQWPVLSPVN